MDTAGITELKKRLQTLPPRALVDICLRLARFKKDNKELLHYVLFESDQEQEYKRQLKQWLDTEFEELNAANSYQARKTIKRILGRLSKQIRYSGIKETEAELLICFCTLLLQHTGLLRANSLIRNQFLRQLKKAETAVSKLHADLQYDFSQQLEPLQLFAEKYR